MTEAKHWFWVLLDVFLAALVLGVMGVGMPVAVQYGASLAPSRMITVSAQGKTTATPDIANMSFSVVTTGQNPQTLEANNTSKMNAALQFLGSQNIATSDIKTTGFDLQPAYNYDNTTQRNYITGYTLTQTVAVKVRDLANVANVLAGLTPLGVNQIGGVEFTFNDSDALVAVARADAMQKAELKAIEMASAAGVSLGRVVNLSENSYIPQPYSVYNMAASAGMGAMKLDAAPNIQPGSQDVTDNVTITYSLR